MFIHTSDSDICISLINKVLWCFIKQKVRKLVTKTNRFRIRTFRIRHKKH